MDGLTAVAVGAVLLTSALVTHVLRRDARAFRRAAEKFGLQTGRRAVTLDGEIDGCRVTARRSMLDEQRRPLVVVHPEPRLPADLGFGPEGLLGSMVQAVVGADVQTGDRAFDDAVCVRGDPLHIFAVLDAANRRIVRRMVADGIVLDGGELRLVGVGARPDLVGEHIPTMVRAARALQVDPARIPTRLLERVRRDPLPGVRQRALEVMLTRLPDDPATEAALVAALKDSEPTQRLRAARQLGPVSEAVEPALRALALDAALDPALRLEALDVYLDRLGARRASPLLVELLDDEPLAAHAVARLTRTGRVEAVPALCARLGRDGGPRSEIITAIGRLGDARDDSLEAALLPLIDHASLRPAIAEALLRIGSPRAIPALLPLTEGLLTDGALKTTARRAIDAIRARQGQVEAGGLSVVPDGADDHLGRLSVAREPGALALDGETE